MKMPYIMQTQKVLVLTSVSEKLPSDIFPSAMAMSRAAFGPPGMYIRSNARHSKAPPMRIIPCTASVHTTARMPPEMA